MKHLAEHHFIGTWQLINWQYLVNNEERKFFKYPDGILIYTKEGNMSAILMDRSRSQFKQPYLEKGCIEEKVEAINGYISYAGTYTVDLEKVYHHVQFSLFPNWIGTVLERVFHFSNDNQLLTLSTSPIVADYEREIKNILTWKRV